MRTDKKPSRMLTQDPQEVNAPGNKPSESQPGASPDQHLVQTSGDDQQGTTGAGNVPAGNTLPNAVNPDATQPGTTIHTTENHAYAHGQPGQEAVEAVNQTRDAPPPARNH